MPNLSHRSITSLSIDNTRRCESFTSRPTPPTPGRTGAYPGWCTASPVGSRGVAIRSPCARPTPVTTGRLPEREDRAAGVMLATGPHGDDVELRVFPNLSNRLAYHLQLFLPIGLNKYLSDHAGTFDVAHLHACRNIPGAMAAYHLHRSRSTVCACTQWDGAADRATPAGQARVRYRDGTTHPRRRGARAGGVERRAAAAARARASTHQPSASSRIRSISTSSRRRRRAGDFRRRFALPTLRAPLVMFLGKLTPRKRLDVLRPRVCAARADRDASAGDCRQRHGRRRRQRGRSFARSVSSARTVFTGLLRASERLEALADADVVVYPSQDEIFGLVPLEALLSGTPVIVADDSGCGEVVRADRRRPGRSARRCRCAGARHRRRARRVHRAGAPPPRPAAVPHQGSLSATTSCARELEQLYGEMVASVVMEGVSFVVPVHNGAACVREALESILAQADGRPMEIIVVDDHQPATIRRRCCAGWPTIWPLRIVPGDGRGAAAAINTGVRAARFPIICQVDQDVVLRPGWMRRLRRASSTIRRSVQCRATTSSDPDATLCARAMGLRPRAALCRDRRAARPLTSAPAIPRIGRKRFGGSACSTRRSATATTTTSAIDCAPPAIV